MNASRMMLLVGLCIAGAAQLTAAPKTTAPKHDTKQAASRPPLKPSVPDTPAPAPAAKDNQVAGSAPIVPPNSFDSRFGAVR